MAEQVATKVKGMNEALKAIRSLGSTGLLGMGQLLVNFGNTKIVAPAKKLTPVVTGNLRSTIATGAPTFSGSKVRVIVSAGGPATPYALKVHENPRSGKTGGLSPSGKKYKRFSKVGQWKYLETPAKEAANNSGGWLAKEASLIMARFKRLEAR